MDNTDIVRIFDTTLRDGEQSPGATLNIDEKLEIARQLARLGVDIIEAGFPIASPGDFEAVRRVAREVGQAGERADHRRAGARDQGRHRPGLGGRARGQAPAHPHLPGHLRHPPAVQAQDQPRGVPEAGGRDGGLCPQPVRRRRVLARGRRPLRPGVPLPGARSGDQGRRDHAEHPGHRRLHHAGRIRWADQGHPRERAGHR